MTTLAVVLLVVAVLAIIQTRYEWARGAIAGGLFCPWSFDHLWPWMDAHWERFALGSTSMVYSDGLALIVLIAGLSLYRSNSERSLMWGWGFIAVIWPKAAVAALVGAAFGWGVSIEAELRAARVRMLGLLFAFGGLFTLYPTLTAHKILPFGLVFCALVVLGRHGKELDVLLDRRAVGGDRK